MCLNRIWVIFLIFVCGFSVEAKQIISFEERLRYEFKNNFNSKFYGSHLALGKQNDGFLLIRTRIGSDWYLNDRFHIAIWIQDSRAIDWGMPERAFYSRSLDSENNPQKDYLELYTTFIELKRNFGLLIIIKIGRQRISYGDNRIFGPGQWGNSGRYIWDAVKFRVIWKGAFIDVFYGRNIIHKAHHFSLAHRHDKSTLAVYAHFPLLRKDFSMVFEPFVFTKWDRHDRFRGEKGINGKLQLVYSGFHMCGKWRFFDWNNTWVGMWGHRGSDSVSAYAYHLETGVRFKDFLKSRVYLAYSYASGDKNPGDGRWNRFDGAFGSVDRAYGRMNLFKWSNLEDTETGVEFWPLKGAYLKLEYHHFRLAQSKDGWSHNPLYYRDPTGSSGKEMGHEFDALANLKIGKYQEIQIGYGHFWPGEFVKKLASTKESNWFFVQYTLKIYKQFF